MTVYHLSFLYFLAGSLSLLIGWLVTSYNRAKKNSDELSFFSHLKTTLKKSFTDFVRLNLPIILILLISRSAQYFIFSSHHILPLSAISLEWQGFIQDVIIWQFISWAILIPFILLSLMKRWVGIFFFGIIFLVYIAFEWTLFEYFTITLTPLDEVIFTYSLKEMAMITENSVEISFHSFLPYLILFLVTVGLIVLSMKLRLSKYLLIGFIIISTSIIAFRHLLIPNESRSRNSFEYFIAVNKTVYLAKKCYVHLVESKESVSMARIEAATKRYQAQHSEFSFPGTKYPFLHHDNTPDVLGSFFNLKNEKPNLVIIIVESLSSCFSGNNNIFGSFTPFLDSLAGHSLYWPNFLSTADRTFNVVEAVMGSMPPGYDSFITPNSEARYPYLLSLVSYLENDGYYTGFYHGGDPTFNNMDDFLIHQKIDYVLRYFGPKYKKISRTGGTGWGYSDADMFNRTFEVLDSINKSPRLDLYLTVSTHTPFSIPDQQYYISQVEKLIEKASPHMVEKDELEKNKTIFSAILYSDHALKECIENYKKRPGYDNTIFLITGDHAMPELNPSRASLIERFHVPLIIFSPMLNKNATFLSVSSHLDIAPSILAFLHNKFGLEINTVASWLGCGIDTASFFRNIHALPFIFNSRQITDYVDHLFYFSPYNFSEIQPDFLLMPKKNPPVRERLRQELDDIKILSNYVIQQNKVVPREVYFGKFLSFENIQIKNPPQFFPNDSTWEYKNILNKLPVDPKFKLLKLEMTFDLTTRETHFESPPKMVIELYGKEKKRIVYNSFEVSGESLKALKPGKWKTTKYEEYIDVSYLHERDNYSMQLYMWNPKLGNFRMANPTVKISGFY
jgi:phosphoglycerol transferase MdoB-like AlkP superfamily enzyme